MKKKLLIAMIPVLGMGALVGSGFSAWVFGNAATQTYGFGGTITVTPATTGELELACTTKKFTITLDQNGEGNTNVDEGVTVTGLDDITFTLKSEEQTVIGEGATHKVQFSFSISLAYSDETSFDKYLVTTATMNTFVGTKVSNADLLLGAGTLVENTLTYTYSAGTWTFTLKTPTDTTDILNYYEPYAAETSGKPRTWADWDAMNDALSGDTFTVNLKVTAKVVAK